MSDMTRNPYEAPQADLNERVFAGGPSGSVDDAVAGRYDFSIGQVMSEAWDLTAGMKASFWGAAIVLYGILAAVTIAVAWLGQHNAVLRFLGNFVLAALGPILMMGIALMGIRRAAGLPVSAATAFGCFDRAVAAMIAGLLTTLLTYAGLFLFVIPGIYLAIAFTMTIPLIADRRFSPWQAMVTSRQAVSKHWFKVAGLLFLVVLLVGISALPFGIGIIWTAPWAVNVMGVVYRRIFGVAQTAPASLI